MKRMTTVAAAFVLAFATNAQHEMRYSNYATYENGDYATEEFPNASVIYWINDDLDRILVDNAANWDGSPPHAVDKNGSYTISLGNFMAPPLAAGDVVRSRYVNNVVGATIEIAETVSMIPWIRGPKTTAVTPAAIPPRPDTAYFEWEGSTDTTSGLTGRWKLTWTTAPGLTYDVYVRYADSLTPTGYSRMEYHRVVEGTTADTYYFGEEGRVTFAPGMGAIVLARDGGVPGTQSVEATNFPKIPIYVNAATCSTSPWKAALTWNYAGKDADMIAEYEIFRGATKNFVADSASKVATAPGDRRAYVDDAVLEGETYHYRVRAVSSTGITGLPSPSASCVIEERFEGKPDLNVLFISRHPKYNRYEIAYNPGGFNPYEKEGTEAWKHYPDNGETMTYIAHVKNTGGATVDSFALEWYVDSVLERTEYYGEFYPERRIVSRLQLPWSSEDPSYIRCEVESISPSPAEELTVLNNHIENRTNALGFDFHVETPMAELFNGWKNKLGSYVIEDWLEYHMITFHRFFDESRFPATPNGVSERVFIDSISFNPMGAHGGGSNAPNNLWADGRWGFGFNEEWFNIVTVEHNDKGYDPGMIHELGHQLGLVDLYAQDIHGTTFAEDFVEPRTGEFPPLEPVVHFDNPVYYYNSRAGDGVMHSHGTLMMSDHSAAGLERNLSQRRGWYGTYMFDFSDDYAYRLTKPDGSPLANYTITIWQRDGQFKGGPKYIGQTNAQGMYVFSHFTQPGFEGGMYTPNPFATRLSDFPHVVGRNATLFIRATKGDSVGYTFHDICDFNMAYWEGDTAFAVIDKEVEQWNIIPATNVERDERDDLLPDDYKLHDAFPNPFNPETRIKYDLKERSRVELTAFNALGERVAELASGEQAAGFYERRFRPSGASGVYFVRLIVRSAESNERFTRSIKVIYLK
jgi:hypothetical protein